MDKPAASEAKAGCPSMDIQLYPSGSMVDSAPDLASSALYSPPVLSPQALHAHMSLILFPKACSICTQHGAIKNTLVGCNTALIISNSKAQGCGGRVNTKGVINVSLVHMGARGGSRPSTMQCRYSQNSLVQVALSKIDTTLYCTARGWRALSGVDNFILQP